MLHTHTVNLFMKLLQASVIISVGIVLVQVHQICSSINSLMTCLQVGHAGTLPTACTNHLYILLTSFSTPVCLRFDIKGVLGAGSFGVVREAVDRITGRKYACKTIPKVPKRGKPTPRYLLKLQQEVDAMQQLGASFDAVYLKVPSPPTLFVLMFYLSSLERVHHRLSLAGNCSL